MLTLLIVEHPKMIIDQIVTVMQDQWDIHVCSDGDSAVRILKELKPDAMIINLELPQKTGLDILVECFPELPSSIIGICTRSNHFIEQHAARWGVDHVFQIPFDMRMLTLALNSSSSLQNIYARRVAQHLRVLGINAGHSGYHALLLSVPILKKDVSKHLHKEVYTEVASILGSDPRAIERAIRIAIQGAWEMRDNDIWSLYFTANSDGDVPCPSNKAFISALTTRI